MKDHHWLSETFLKHWSDKDIFECAWALQGIEYRALENRRTLQFSLDDQSFFIKLHKGGSWKEIFKNLLSGRLPVISARNEWIALKRMEALGLKAPKVEAYAKRGLLPATLESFIVTRDLGAVEDLEKLCKSWAEKAPDFRFKQRLISEIAKIARTLHENNMCHRDFYICHFMYDENRDDLYLIDLHRALLKSSLRKRWKIKDIGGLYFSAFDIGLTRRDLFRFMKQYRNCSLRQTLSDEGQFWQAVEKRAKRI